MKAKLACFVALGLGVAAPPGAFAREWTRIIERGSVLPSGHAHEAQYRESFVVRSDGTVIFASSSSGYPPSINLIRWSPAARLEQIAAVESEIDFGGVEGLDVSAGFDALADAGPSGVVLTRPVSAPFCVSPLTDQHVVVRIGDAGEAATLIQPGAAAPGFDPGWLLTGDVVDGVVRTNGTGSVALLAAAAFDGACSLDPFAPLAKAVYVSDGGDLALVAVEGQEAPELPGGILRDFGAPSLSDSDRVVFDATIDMGPFAPAFPALLGWDAASGLSVLVRAGQEVEDVTVFEAEPGAGFPFAIGARGDVAFVARTRPFDATAEGLFVAAPDGSIALRHRTGDPAPGSTGATFLWFHASSYRTYEDPFQIELNARGEVAFVATAPAPGASGVIGLWAPDASGALALKLWIGQELPDRPGERIEKIEKIEMRGFSDDRRLLVRIKPTSSTPEYLLIGADGTAETLIGVGAFLTSAGSLRADSQLRSFAASNYQPLYASVPEPGWGPVAALIALATLRRRR